VAKHEIDGIKLEMFSSEEDHKASKTPEQWAAYLQNSHDAYLRRFEDSVAKFLATGDLKYLAEVKFRQAAVASYRDKISAHREELAGAKPKKRTRKAPAARS
jgi:hypothetical protein